MMNAEKQSALDVLKKINAVEGFDPTPLALEYTDLNSGEKRMRLPVMVQLAWFRLKYPEGRISVSAAPAKDCFVATARVYRNYADPVEHFLAEATASRGPLVDMPTVLPREWAQTAAIGIALRNAGFGLQFGAAGDSFEAPAVDELGGILWTNGAPEEPLETNAKILPGPQSITQPTAPMDTVSPFEKAMKVLCPINKYKGKTLGDVLLMDPGAINWVATKYKGDPDVSAAAKLICEESLKTPA